MASGGSGDGRGRILDAAQHLFARQGFAATPVKDIASDAGVATGLLYYHFGTKEELYAALVAERSIATQLDEVLTEVIEAASNGGEEPQVTLRRLAHAVLDVFEERREMARILLQDAATNEDGGARLHRLLHNELGALTQYLHMATQAGRQAAERAGRILITHMLVGAVLLQHPDREQLVRSTVEMVLATLA